MLLKTKRLVSAILFGGLMLFCGCREQGNAVLESARFRHSRVALPENVLKIEKGKVDSMFHFQPLRPVMVHYYGSKECTDCAFSPMRDYLKYLDFSKKNGGFDFYVIMAPPVELRDSVVDRAAKMSLPLTILIDDSYFLEKQESFPSSASFHTFLLDVDGRPAFIGSPFRNKSTLKKFSKRLDALHSNIP